MKPNNKSTASYPWKWILLGILLVVVACSWQNAKDSMTYNYKSIIENVREVQSKSGMEVESSTLESTGPELGLHNVHPTFPNLFIYKMIS